MPKNYPLKHRQVCTTKLVEIGVSVIWQWSVRVVCFSFRPIEIRMWKSIFVEWLTGMQIPWEILARQSVRFVEI
jgi:hypothetical protein